MPDDTLSGSADQKGASNPFLPDSTVPPDSVDSWQMDGIVGALASASNPSADRFQAPAFEAPLPDAPASFQDFGTAGPGLAADGSQAASGGAGVAASGAGTVSVTATGTASIDGLLMGAKWSAPSGLTYSFPNSTGAYASPNPSGSNEQASGFQPLSAQERAVMRAVLEGTAATGVMTYGSFESFTILDFTEVSGSSGAVGAADIRMAVSSAADPTAYGYYPNPASSGGDIWFGASEFGTGGTSASPTPGSWGYLTGIHEVGHALGLKHPHDTDFASSGFGALPVDQDSLEFTVMSYRSYTGASTSTGYTNETFGYPTTPMMLDIQALQKLYRADYTLNDTNTTYSWSPTTGEMSVNGVGQGAPGGNRIFLTIWDGGGRDGYDMSNYTNGVSVDLNPGKWSVTSETQRAILDVGFSGSVIKSRGTVFNALLFNNDTASLIEDAVGGAGDDTILGNLADNSLVGGGGADILYGDAGADTLVGDAGADQLYGSDTAGTGTDGDLIDGGGGNDTILGAGGADTILGGEGDNRIDGGAGNDSITAGTGNDSIFTGDGNNYVDAGDGNNSVIGGTGSDTVLTGAGNDYVVTDANDSIVTGAGDDTIDTGIDNDTIDAGAGNDSINAGDGEDIVQAGADNDTIYAGTGNDSIDAGTGDDWVDAGAGNDTVLGGAGNDTIDGGAGDDLIIWHSGDGSDTILGGLGTDTLQLDGWDGAFGTGTDSIANGTYGSWVVSGSAADRILVNGSTTIHAAGFDGIACFAAGTRIATARGEVPVEALRLGDLVVTAGRGAGLRPIRWLGRTRADIARHPDRTAIAPILVRAGALGSGAPHRDLRVSPDHALHLDGHLVPAALLVNGTTILQELWCPAVEYWHVELDSHGLLIAEGALAESYLDDGNRGQFDNGPITTLFKDFACNRASGTYDRMACLPVLRAGETLAAIRERLAPPKARRAGAPDQAPPRPGLRDFA